MRIALLRITTLMLLAGCNARDFAVAPPDPSPDAPNAPAPDDPKAPGPQPAGPECADDLVFFDGSISEPVLQRDCIMCHQPAGIAASTRLVLASAGELDHLERNFETLRRVAAEKIGGVSLLLLKPTQEVPHLGGQRFQAGSEQYLAFEQLVHRFDHPNSCESPVAPEEPVDPSMPPPPPPACNAEGPQPGSTPLRPLSSEQLANTVRDLFPGVDLTSALHYAERSINDGFSTFIGANIHSQASTEEVLDTAEAVARSVVGDLDALLGCAAGQAEADCVAAFVHRFGARAFRRPLEAEEHAGLMTLYALSGLSLADRVGMIVEAVLQSAPFLYLEELGGEPIGGDLAMLTPHAIAAKLSYFLWNTIPDQQLLSLAQSGGLREPAQIEAEARRMIADPRARDVLARFHRDWLHLQKLRSGERDSTVYPEYDAALAGAMEKEVELFVRRVLWEEEGTFSDLLSSKVAFTNPDLDALYGTDSGSSGPEDFREVSLPEDQRAGILTRAGFLASHAYDASSSPIARGVFVLRNMLCLELEIPPGLVTEAPEEIDGTTARERLAQHRDAELCASCHDQIDPIGLSMEHFDGIGRWRDDYANGREIDATGSLQDPPGEFDGALALSALLKESGATRDCYATQWYRYAFGRVEDTGDACAVELLSQQFERSGGNVAELMVAISTSDTFRYRRI